MKKRNDDAADIERCEWNVLLYGEKHFTNRFTTEASLEAITRDDLVDFHRQYFHPANMIAAVSGAFIARGHDRASWRRPSRAGRARSRRCRRCRRRSRPRARASTASRRTSPRGA